MQVEGLTIPGLHEPPWLGGRDLVVAFDPGERTGWAAARIDYTNGKLKIVAVGTSPASGAPGAARSLAPRTAHLIVEEPARRGTFDTATLYGRILEAVHAHAMHGGLELHIVRPTQWKQYPAKRRDMVIQEWVTGEGAVATNRHERDAINMIAWWYLVGGREDLHERG